MGMVFLVPAMRGEQKPHAKPTACWSKDFDGTGEKPVAGQPTLPPSLLVAPGDLQVHAAAFPQPILTSGDIHNHSS